MGQVQCGACFGQGKITCGTCSGRRYTTRLTVNLEADTSPCMGCGGYGKTNCHVCHGSGKIYTATPDPMPSASPMPGPQVSAPPPGIEGTWLAHDGSRYEIEGSGPHYTVTGRNAFGMVVDHGTAFLQNGVATLTITNALIGTWQCPMRVTGQEMNGRLVVMGFPMPFRLQRIAWPQRQAPAPPPPPDPGAKFRELMASANQAKEAGDLERARTVYLQALDVAMDTPEPDDDLMVLQHVLLLSRQLDLPEGTLKKCLRAVLALVEKGHANDAVGQCLAFVSLQVETKPIEKFTERLATAGRKVLRAPLVPEVRLALAWATIKKWLMLSRVDDADAILDDLRTDDLDGDGRLELAGMQSAVALAGADRDGATDVLVKALEKEPKTGPLKRIDVISKIVSFWPPGRPGVEKWQDELTAGAEALEEPMRSLVYLQVALSLARAGKVETAEEMIKKVNAAKVREGAPPGLLKMLDTILAQIDGAMAEARRQRGTS